MVLSRLLANILPTLPTTFVTVCCSCPLSTAVEESASNGVLTAAQRPVPVDDAEKLISLQVGRLCNSLDL